MQVRAHTHVQIHIQTHPHTQPNAQAHAHAQAWNLEQASLGRDTEQAQNYRSTTENRRQRPRAHAHITVPRQIHVSEHAVAAMIPRKEEASLGHTWGERPLTDTKRTQLLAQHMAVVVCMFPRAQPRPDLPQLQHKTLPATLSVRRREDASQCHLWAAGCTAKQIRERHSCPQKKPVVTARQAPLCSHGLRSTSTNTTTRTHCDTFGMETGGGGHGSHMVRKCPSQTNNNSSTLLPTKIQLSTCSMRPCVRTRSAPPQQIQKHAYIHTLPRCLYEGGERRAWCHRPLSQIKINKTHNCPPKTWLSACSMCPCAHTHSALPRKIQTDTHATVLSI
jgi:hypothetical protein